MIEKVHQHIVTELQQSSRTDTIFVITAVLLNLIVLAINSAVAGNAVSKNPNPIFLNLDLDTCTRRVLIFFWCKIYC